MVKLVDTIKERQIDGTPKEKTNWDIWTSLGKIHVNLGLIENHFNRLEIKVTIIFVIILVIVGILVYSKTSGL